MANDPIFDRLPVYEEDDRVVYRASSLGYCTGMLARVRMGLTPSLPPDFMLEKYQEGHDWEARVLEAGLGVDWLQVPRSEMERLGTVVEGANGEVQVERDLLLNREGTRVVRVHPDAIVRRGVNRAKGELSRLYVCEVKFLAPDLAVKMSGGPEPTWDEFSEGYKWQAAVQMLAFDMPMLYVIGAKGRDGDGTVTGVSWVTTLEFNTPPYTLADVKMRVAGVEGAVARGELPGCPVPFDYPCGFWDQHEARDAEVIEDDVLEHLLESYERNTAKGEAVATEREEIRKQVDARLGELGVKSGVCRGWKVALTDNRPGNVSWKTAYDALAKQTKSSVDVDLYRGAEVEGGVRMEKAKGGGDG